jgi:two-component system, OmpR family, response regulator RegX3
MSVIDGSGAVRALVVCDVDAVCRLPAIFAAEGWDVAVASVDVALKESSGPSPDLVVLHDLPIHLATRACAAVHAESRPPIIAMASSLKENDVVAGLHAGIDAFVPDGVGDRELVARARALLRRYVRQESTNGEENDVLVVHPVVLDRASRLVTVLGESIPMPRREFDILELLMRDAPRTVTRSVLLRELWVAAPDSQTLDVQVRRLRARLAAACGGVRLIVTVRGVGYRFLTSDGADTATDDAPVDIDLTAPQHETIDLTPHSDDDPVRGPSGSACR